MAFVTLNTGDEISLGAGTHTIDGTGKVTFTSTSAQATYAGAGGAADTVAVVGASTDYNASKDGTNLVLTHKTTGKTITIASGTTADTVTFSNGSLTLQYVTGTGIKLGTQVVSNTTPAAISDTPSGTGTSTGSTSAQTFVLTTSIDNLSGGSGDDTFIGGNGASNTTGPADQLNGGAGTDTFKMYGGATNTTFPTISNIENLYLNGTTAGLDISAMSAVKSLEADAVVGQTYTITTGQTATLSNVTGGQTINIAGNTPTSVDVTVNSFGQISPASQQILDLLGTSAATLNLTSKTAASNLSLANTGGKLATLNFAGDQAVTLDTALTSITTINAATATGGLNVNSIGASNLAFTGGSGNDRLNLVATLTAADTADGGAGTDTLAVSSGATLTTSTAVGIKNFEILEATGTTAGTLDVDTVIAKNALTGIKVSATTSATVNNINDAATSNIVVSAANTGGLTFTAKNFVAGGTSDTATIKLDNSVTKAAAGIDVGTGLTFVNLDTLNLVSLSDGTTAKTIASNNGNSITALTTADLEKITITGNESVTLATDTATVGLTEVDASALTGKAALSVNTSAAANISLLVKGTANVDTINTSNAATVSTTLYTGGGNDVVTLNGATTAVNTLKFTTTALSAGELKAGTDLGITLSNGAAGGQVILDFGTAVEALLKVGSTVLGSTGSNVTVQGTTLGANTNVASAVAASGGNDVTTIQFDLDGDGAYVAANDAQITITVTGIVGANDTLVYNAANDYFVFTVV